MSITNVQADDKVAGLIALAMANAAVPTAIGRCFTVRRRFTLAEINATVATVFVPGILGYRYRVVELAQIAIGGAAGGATAVRMVAVQAAASVAIVTTAIAALTQSTIVDMGVANAVVLADGASNALCDTNTGFAVDKTGASLTTCTAVDYILTFAVEEA